MFTTRFQAWVRGVAQSLARGLAKSPLSPNQVTVVGMLITFSAALLLGLGYLRAAGLVLAFSGLFDILDGALARVTQKMRPFGAFLDSTIDRYSEAAVYLGLSAYFLDRRDALMRPEVLICILALVGSLLVSYARARAEALGFTSSVGLFARPERVVVIVIALLIGNPWVLAAVVALLALMTNLTVLQRMAAVWGQARLGRTSVPHLGSPSAGSSATPKSAGDTPPL